MAASSKENDYYHILCSGLKTHESQLTSYAYNFSAWEMLSYDRAESIDIIDGYLSDNLDLVVIQLGENVNDLDSFEDDFEYLIKYISLKAPKAKIIIIGNFWSKSKTDDLKNNIAKKCGVGYIDLGSIEDKWEYQIGINGIVLGEDGEKHRVEHNGVAKHPNDEAMKYFADKILDELY